MFKKIKYKDIEYFLKVSPKNGYIDNQIYVYNIYEKETYKIMYDNIKKNDICVDVGANIGVFTNFLPKLVGKGGKVFGFEPIKKIYEQNLESIKKNKYSNVYLFNYACSNEAGKTIIHVNDDNIGASSIIDSNARNGSYTEEIETVLLDNILLNEDRIDFLKIDTEGFELNVLKGARKIIKKYHPKIFMEFVPSLHKEKNDGKELLNIIKDNYKNVYIPDINKILNLSNPKDLSLFFDLTNCEGVNILVY